MDPIHMETDEGREQKRDANNFKEGMRKQLCFLQDIPPDQRTQRHTMQMEYYILVDKCAETVEMAPPVAFHASLARIVFLSQVSPLCTLKALTAIVLGLIGRGCSYMS